MSRHLFLLVIAALMFPANAIAAPDNSISYPEAPAPSPDHLVTPPRENPYFYVRPDGQAYTIQTDHTNNITDYLNRHYYDFAWRGEVWSPYDNMTTVEKGSRLMGTWPEYNEATRFRVLNGWNQFWEKWSGFGP
ncbi:MAG: hypothetical protein K2W82_15820 [Candidatus Obscuribacterales bacterium]|nr:hypothetical protein [Candidatus Obscuribacterales bacterium]